MAITKKKAAVLTKIASAKNMRTTRNVLAKAAVPVKKKPTVVRSKGLSMGDPTVLAKWVGDSTTSGVQVSQVPPPGTPAEEIMQILSTFTHGVQNDILAEVMRSMASRMRSKLEHTRSEYEISDKELSEFYNIVNGGYEKGQKGASLANANKSDNR